MTRIEREKKWIRMQGRTMTVGVEEGRGPSATEADKRPLPAAEKKKKEKEKKTAAVVAVPVCLTYPPSPVVPFRFNEAIAIIINNSCKKASVDGQISTGGSAARCIAVRVRAAAGVEGMGRAARPAGVGRRTIIIAIIIIIASRATIRRPRWAFQTRTTK